MLLGKVAKETIEDMVGEIPSRFFRVRSISRKSPKHGITMKQ